MAIADPETLLHTVIEGIGQPFYALDPDWRFVLYNEEAALYFDRPAADVLGRTLWDVFPGDDTHQRGRVLREAMASRTPVKGEAPSMIDGRIVAYCLFPLGSGLGVTFRDITEHRNAERLRDEAEEALRKRTAELATVLETIPTAVWFSYDPDLRHVYGNRRASELLRTPHETDLAEILGAPATLRVRRDGEDLPPARRPLHRAARGEIVTNEVLEVEFGDGDTRMLLMRAVPLRGPDGTVQGAVCAAADVTERHRYEDHLKLVLAELNHRVKNTLAIVQSIAALTFRGADSGARTDFQKRLMNLGAVHTLLTAHNWESARLCDIVNTALGTQDGGTGGRIRIEGQDFRLRPKSAVSVSMALHELATNALKYGALSNDRGRVEVDWREVDGRFRMTWREAGGPAVSPPASRGFGSRMIEQGLASELQGQVRIEFHPDGVVCTIDAPIEAILDGA